MIAVLAIVVLLCVKYFWTLFAFDVPLGYDTGIYRYLFLRHASGFPPFAVASMDAWAYEHPLGLFFFSSLLIKAGIPVDWLIGWMWNAMPVTLSLVLSEAFRKSYGRNVGLLVLLFCLLSIAQFHGFIAMYWKTFASLLFAVPALYYWEKKSWWALLWLMLAMATHQQTGLLVTLAVALSLLTRLFQQKGSMTRLFVPSLLAIAAVTAALLWYLPVWRLGVANHLPKLLSGPGADGGSFPSLSVYLLYGSPLYLFAVIGWIRDMRDRKTLTAWHWTFVLATVFAVGHFFFYRRFILHADFYALPFAAIGAASMLWSRSISRRWLSAGLIILQGILSLSALASLPAQSVVSQHELAELHKASRQIEHGAYVIVLDPEYAPWVLGWLPNQHVSGPGVFDSPWVEEKWSLFLLGSGEGRRAMLSSLGRPMYLYTSPLFRSHYGEYADAILSDAECLEPVITGTLFRWACP